MLLLVLLSPSGAFVFGRVRVNVHLNLSVSWLISHNPAWDCVCSCSHTWTHKISNSLDSCYHYWLYIVPLVVKTISCVCVRTYTTYVCMYLRVCVCVEPRWPRLQWSKKQEWSNWYLKLRVSKFCCEANIYKYIYFLLKYIIVLSNTEKDGKLVSLCMNHKILIMWVFHAVRYVVWHQPTGRGVANLLLYCLQFTTWR